MDPGHYDELVRERESETVREYREAMAWADQLRAKIRAALGADRNESTLAAAERVVRERDEARQLGLACVRSSDQLLDETRRLLGAASDEDAVAAAERVAGERDEAIARAERAEKIVAGVAAVDSMREREDAQAEQLSREAARLRRECADLRREVAELREEVIEHEEAAERLAASSDEGFGLARDLRELSATLAAMVRRCAREVSDAKARAAIDADLVATLRDAGVEVERG